MPPFMPLRETVVNYGLQLGYQLPAFICYGFATSCLELLITGDKKTFFQFLDLLFTGQSELSEIEVKAFYEKILLYQNPEKFAALFNADLSQIHLETISFFASSWKMEKIGYLLPLNSITNTYTPQELEQHIETLANIFYFDQKKKHTHKKVAFILSDNIHSIGLYFDQTAKFPRWILIDTEDSAIGFYSVQQTKLLADKIFASLTKVSNLLCCNTTIIIPGKDRDKYLNEQLAKIREHNDNRLQNKRYSRIVSETLAYLACYLNDPQTFMIAHERILHSQQTYRNDLLYLAILNHDEDALLGALENQADPNGLPTFEMPPLIWAAINKNAQFIKILLQYGADVNQRDRFDNTVLHLLCQYGDLETIKYILQHSLPDINALNTEQMSPLFIAAYKGYEEITYLFLTHPKLDTSAHFWLGSKNLLMPEGSADNFVKSLNPTAQARFKHWRRSARLFGKNQCLSPYEVARITGHDTVADSLLKYTHQKNKALFFYPETQIQAPMTKVSHRALQKN